MATGQNKKSSLKLNNHLGMWVSGVVVISALVFASIKTDYLAWKHEETKRFGYGPSDINPSVPALEKIWQNQLLRLRIKMPNDWNTADRPEFGKFVNGRENELDIVLAGGKRMLAMEVLGKLRVYAQSEALALTDVADREVKKLKEEGFVLEEREYLNSDKAKLTLIKYSNGDMKFVRALTLRDTTLIVIQGEASIADEAYFAILGEVLKSVVVI